MTEVCLLLSWLERYRHVDLDRDVSRYALIYSVNFGKMYTDSPNATDLSAPYAHGEYGGYSLPYVVVRSLFRFTRTEDVGGTF